jgi:predicted DNA-binding transcriptional regulator AlpA
VVSVRPLATDDDFCAFTGLAKQQSAQLRYLGTGPRFIRVTGRQIRYDWSEIEAWCESRTVCRSDQRSNSRRGPLTTRIQVPLCGRYQ